MGQHLGLHRLADKSGKAPAEGEAWPLAGVEITAGPPDEIEFSDRYVASALAEIAAGAPAWLELTNSRPHATSITVPKGADAGKDRPYPRGMVITGDEIVLRVAEARPDAKGRGAKRTFRYRVLEAPGIYLDDAEPAGYRISHAYRCELVKGD